MHIRWQNVGEDDGVKEGADGGLADEGDKAVEEDNACQGQCYGELEMVVIVVNMIEEEVHDDCLTILPASSQASTLWEGE